MVSCQENERLYQQPQLPAQPTLLANLKTQNPLHEAPLKTKPTNKQRKQQERT